MFPHTITDNVTEVRTWIEGIGAEAFTISEESGTRFAQLLGPNADLKAGDTACTGYPASNQERALEFAVWHRDLTAFGRRPEPWFYAIAQDFSETLNISTDLLFKTPYPAFALLEKLAGLLEGYGYPRTITAPTLVLYYFSNHHPARYESSLQAGTEQLRMCADLIVANPPLILDARVEVICLGISMPELATYLDAAKGNYSLVRELYLRQSQAVIQ